MSRLRVVFRGAVQGVGFRPFIYRLATELGLHGYVTNTPDGAVAEVEGPRVALQVFLVRSQEELPPRAAIHSLESTVLDPAGHAGFTIRESVQHGTRTTVILPDIATCQDCLRELFDPNDRRYRYPFINCTNCGPRYSIILRLPYDRPHTTMRHFRMCPECLREYENPLDRRFHAQPNACPACGPHVELWDRHGGCLSKRESAIAESAEALRAGKVVAVKGLGGFHLMVDASNENAVRSLRQHKRREAKPLAVMFPNMDAIQSACEVSQLERRCLEGPERPILLLQKASDCDAVIAPSVAPDNPQLGVMLPYTPLHHLLLREVGIPLVATSGNISDEPICTDEHDALNRLADIAELFLVHNRPIARHVDDSVVRVVLDREQVLRRARGYAPLPVSLPMDSPVALAVGPHLKCAGALAVGRSAYVSQHIGDLDTYAARRVHARVLRDLTTLYEQPPACIATDLHPDYASTIEADRLARELERNGATPQIVPVQHHYAHVLSCMAEHELTGPVLGVSWDGTGLGADGTIWGGEWLVADVTGYQRVAYLRPFGLPGGEAATREPRRSAAGVLFEVFGADASRHAHPDVPSEMMATWLHMLKSGTNVYRTTSAGRLFDCVASLLGLQQVCRFEGQAAMELEWAIRSGCEAPQWNVAVHEREDGLEVDWEPLVRGILLLRDAARPVGVIAKAFHDALVRGIVEVATRVGHERIVLSGGCFQNRYLTENAYRELTREGFRVYVHQRVPPNDGGIALGQLYAVAGRWRKVS